MATPSSSSSAPPHDKRIPSPTQPINSIYLISPDGFKEHYMTLLHRFPDELQELLKRSRRERRKTIKTVFPEDAVERAVENGGLRHWSDGPRGGIWILTPSPTSTTNLSLITILVDEMEVLRLRREASTDTAVGDTAGWEVLGKGRKGSEGLVFLLHPCGKGGVDEEEVAAKEREKFFEKKARVPKRGWEAEKRRQARGGGGEGRIGIF